MEQIGEITAVRGSKLVITFCRPEECEKCHGCAGHHKASVLEVEGTAEVGDTAIVSLPNGTLVKASLLAYVLPIVGLLLGMGIGWIITSADLGSAVGGLIGLLLMATISFVTEKKRRNNPEWQPQVTKIISKESNTSSSSNH